MDVVTLITIIAIGALIAAITLFVRQRGGAPNEDYDDADDYDDYDEADEDILDDDSDIFDDDDNQDTDEDGEDYEDNEYEIEEVPLEAYKATVVGMDIERRQNGSYRSPRSHLVFLAEFKVQKSKNNSEIITLGIPEDIYSDIRLGENALLVVQGGRFIDFGDRYAEDADEEDIEAAQQHNATNNKKTKADDK